MIPLVTMNVQLNLQAIQAVGHFVPCCKNCIHFTSNINKVFNYCNKFKKSPFIARLTESKCGFHGKEFEIK